MREVARATRTRIPVVVLAALLLAGCGSSGGGSSAGLSPDDKQVIAVIDARIRDWNRNVAIWSKAYAAGDRAAFRRTEAPLTSKLRADSETIQLQADRIGEADLKRPFVQIRDLYRKQLLAVVIVNRSVLHDDARGAQIAFARLQRMAQAKIRVAKRLAETHPEVSL
ncbi:MAG: hypothetical protein QOE06_2032 [Thermoleophilaceae bacterium]|nr:hypothetical protein [Thermoleophilaceae bacterium]